MKGWQNPEVTVYKILLPAEWGEFETAGVFEGSPLDRADGFVHLSSAAQVAGTARRFFAGEAGLVVLEIDEAAFGDALRWEPAATGESFPHLYAPLPMSAVRAVHRFPGAEAVAGL